MLKFSNPNDPDNLVIISKVKEWIKRGLDLADDTTIKVMEADCADSGCADKETRIEVVLKDSSVKNYRIHKPLVYVRQPDVKHVIKK